MKGAAKLETLKKALKPKPVDVDSIATGLHCLDGKSLFNKGQITVIGGYPGMGTTTIASILALSISKKEKTLFYSFERPYKNTLENFRRYVKDNDQGGKNLYLYDQYYSCLDEFYHTIREVLLEKKIELLVIDGIHHFATIFNGEEDILLSQVISTLKEICLELGVCMIVTCGVKQENAFNRATSRTWVYDLVGGKSLESQVDNILLIYRPIYDGVLEGPDGNSTEGIIEVNIAKSYLASLSKSDFTIKYNSNFTQLTCN
jgi:replicative DNA helicase